MSLNLIDQAAQRKRIADLLANPVESAKELEQLRQQLASRDAEIATLREQLEAQKKARISAQASGAKLLDQREVAREQVKMLRDTIFGVRDGSMGLWGDDLINCNKALAATEPKP